jgi:hypothetical protein
VAHQALVKQTLWQSSGQLDSRRAGRNLKGLSHEVETKLNIVRKEWKSCGVFKSLGCSVIVFSFLYLQYVLQRYCKNIAPLLVRGDLFS